MKYITTISLAPSEWTPVGGGFDASWLWQAVRLGVDGPFLVLDAIAVKPGTLTVLRRQEPVNRFLTEKLEELDNDEQGSWQTVKIGEQEYIVFARPPQVEHQPVGENPTGEAR